MIQTTTIEKRVNKSLSFAKHMWLLRVFFAGLLATLGFAPFHLPGLSILSLALLFTQLNHSTSFKHSFFIGFTYGLGFFGLGVTWIYVSIHQYGHLNPLLSGAITALFVTYLSCFPALATFLYVFLQRNRSLLFRCFLFSALWCLNEYLRANCFGGFPWLLLGFGQIDTPLKHLLPLIGVYGVGFLTCFLATCLYATLKNKKTNFKWLIIFMTILLAPAILKNIQWTQVDKKPITVGVIQGNLSMRDKWDESLFWTLLTTYQKKIESLIGKKDLIVLPESAIPLPAHYISDVLTTLDDEAKQKDSAILLGIPYPTDDDELFYYNTISSLGTADGAYFKQQLVPFGEYIPETFTRLIHWLSIPVTNLKPGQKNQTPVSVAEHPIATLICYELAYPNLLKKQLPDAQWIVSISDDGWFGHSLAMYQHLQMAQVLSVLTGRYQIVANNDGLSSTIDDQGIIHHSLPAFTDGILEDIIFAAKGLTLWTYIGDKPMLGFCFFIFLIAFFKRYPFFKAVHKKRITWPKTYIKRW